MVEPQVRREEKVAEKLFVKIRISLLPDEVLNGIVSKSRSMRSISVFMHNKECVKVVRDVRINKANYKENDRCCGLSKFSILVCGGIKPEKIPLIVMYLESTGKTSTTSHC